MSSPRFTWRTGLAGLATAALTTTVLAGCSADLNAPITIATTVEIPSLDPAAVAEPDAVAVLRQLYPRLLASDAETGAVIPALAASASFTSETEYTVTLPAGLSFANGNELTASDVVFSFERQSAIPGGAVTKPLLTGLASVAAADAHTVVFELEGEDATFPAVLAGAAGAILDEEVFAADAVTPDDVIVAGGGFAGEWQLAAVTGTTYTLIAADDDPARPTGRRLLLTTGLSGDEVVARVTGGSAIAGFGELTAEQHAALSAVDGVPERSRVGGGLRVLAFDGATQPFGTATEDADEDKALAVRQAVAALVDRAALAEAAGAGWHAESHWLPSDAAGEAMTATPSATADATVTPAPSEPADARETRAAEILAANGITTPVALEITRPADTADITGDAVYAEVETQLEAGGLFEVDITLLDVPFDRTLLSEERFAALDVRADPLERGDRALLAALYSSWAGLPIGIDDSTVDAAIRELESATAAEDRAEIIARIEERLSSTLTTIPLLSDRDVLYLGPAVPENVDVPELEWFDRFTP